MRTPLGEKLKALRKEKCVQQQQMAVDLSMHRTHLCRIENGLRNATNQFLRRAVEYFDNKVTLEELQLLASKTNCDARVEKIAFALYLQRVYVLLKHGTFPPSDYKEFELAQFKDWKALKSQAHSGRCVGGIMDCRRCMYEAQLETAKRIINLFEQGEEREKI